jgi:hypothetical protein
MPIISTFFGITIRINFRDHEPAHLHAAYQGRVAVIRIADAAVEDGGLHPRALRLVVDWIARHRAELLENWRRARRKNRS